MRTSEARSSRSTARSGNPFFSKNGDGSFFNSGISGSAPTRAKGSGRTQAKLKIGATNDPYEREADSVADRVVKQVSNSLPGDQHRHANGGISNTVVKRSAPEDKPERKEMDDEPIRKEEIQRKPIFESNADPDDDPPVQRKCEACSEEEMVSRKEEASAGSDAPDRIESRLKSSEGGGKPLTPDVNASMSKAMGYDFGDVRIHNDKDAEQMSDDLNAKAFTHGNDIYFNAGNYDTNSTAGRHLLAHELTHTVQQGSVSKKQIDTKPDPDIQRAAPKAPVLTVSSGVVNVGSSEFRPSDAIREEIVAAGEKGLDVRVIVPGISEEGRIRIKADRKGNFDSMGGKGYMAVTNPWAQQLGGLYLRFAVKDNVITGGFVSPSTKGGDFNDWFEKVKKNAAVLGGVGLKLGKLPKIKNEFSGNSFTIGFENLDVEVGGFLKAQFNLSLENGAKPRIDAKGEVDVEGVVKGQLLMNNMKDKLTGEVSLGIAYKDFTGSVLVKYLEDGSIDIKGKGGYNANRLSGEIDFVSTDLESANNFAKDAIKEAGGKENVQNATPPAAAPAPKEGKKKRALAAVGKLQFNLTKWFAGTVNVIVDGKGDVTVIGKIAPPAEIPLFDQKNFEKEIISLQVEAGYGIPVIGTIGLFAGIGLWAVAYIGPAKLYNIEVTGTYSTDPEVQKNIEIAASINISAYAGLRLRAEGGLKLTILSHDLKLGVGVNADVGVKAYADARPTIGYRDPGEFFISGTADLVAQPMLGLSGDFFIEVDAPWWSPIDDDIWKWPIGSKEWPMGDPIGLSATMKDYVLGSGVAPEIDINKKPQFDPGKFMTKMVDKELPEKSGAGKEAQGTFKDDGTVPPHEVTDPHAQAPKDPSLKGPEPPPLKEGVKKPPPDPAAQKEAARLFDEGAKKLKNINGPITKADLRKDLDNIEKSLGGIHYSIALDGDKWAVTASAKGIDNPKPYRVGAIVTDADKMQDGKDKSDNIGSALEEIDIEGKKETDEGGVTEKEAQAIRDKVNSDHPSVIQITSVTDGGETWDFEYIQKKKKSISKGSRPIKTIKTEIKQNSKSAKAFPLTSMKGGSESTIDIEGWDHARKLNFAKSPDTQGRGGDWVKGHKISYRLGGEGNDASNLFIIDRSANGKMAGTEVSAQQELNRLIALKDANDPEYSKVMYYEIKFDLHGSSLPMKAFADSIAIKYGTANEDGGNKTEKGSLELTSERPPENADVVNFNINNTGWETFFAVTKNKGIKTRFATNLMAVRNEKGKYKNFGDLERKMLANHDSNISEEAVTEQLAILSNIVDEALNVIVK